MSAPPSVHWKTGPPGQLSVVAARASKLTAAPSHAATADGASTGAVTRATLTTSGLEVAAQRGLEEQLTRRARTWSAALREAVPVNEGPFSPAASAPSRIHW